MIQPAKGWFRLSAGVIFSITGMAKVWSAWGGALILQRLDPIFDVEFGHLMIATGILELAVAAICLLSKSKTTATVAVAWLATGLLVYRLGLWWIGWQRPCSCLGNLTDALHIPPGFAENMMKCLLAYLLIGSYAILALFWWRQTTALRPAGPAFR